MELSEAVNKAAQILNEERARPTIGYEAVYEKTDPTSVLGGILRAQDLLRERSVRPRPVHESPYEFRIKGVNYELMPKLLAQVPDSDRQALVAFLLSRVPDPTSVRHDRAGGAMSFPSWNNYISELPLVAEFCIRAGYKGELVRAVGESQVTQGLLLLLMQLGDTISLNFNLFSDQELEQLATVLTNLRTRAHRKTYKFSRPRGAVVNVLNSEYESAVAPVAAEIVAVCAGITEECKQARYWYLKGALQQSANLEINQDRARVEGFLKSLGFSGPLLGALNAAEQDFRGTATPFELKNCLGHLRSFLEGLHEQACRPAAAKAGTSPPKKWSKSTEMLRGNDVLSVQEETFARSLYTLISDEGVHPLIAEREYARLLRNMVVEYGLMFLTKLDKKGINR